MKAVFFALALSLLTIPAVATMNIKAAHGVERGVVEFPKASIVPADVKDVVSSTISGRCASHADTFTVSTESVKSVRIDQGQTDRFYTLNIDVKDASGASVDTITMTVADLAISNPAFPSVEVDALSSASGLCR